MCFLTISLRCATVKNDDCTGFNIWGFSQFLIKSTGSKESENNYLDYESLRRALMNLVS